jgi:hypothetical protein
MRILLTLALGLFSIGANAQSFQAVEGTDVQYYPSANGFMDCAIHLKNLTQAPVVLQYKKVSVDFPSTWDISFCDNRNCFGGFVDEDTMSAIAPDDEKNSLKLSVFPNGKSDTAVVVYEVWNKYTPADKITLTYTIMVRWGASTESYEVVTRVSPNPANDFVQLPVADAQLLDVQGRIVSNTTTGSLNLLEVPNGIYFVRFVQNNSWVNQRLVVKH